MSKFNACRKISFVRGNIRSLNVLNIHFVCIFLTDNHPVHHVREVINRIYNSGVLVRFLPPYSPDLNPIEEAFAKVKHFLRQNDLVLQCAADPLPLIWDAFAQITPDDCQGYMHHAGYI